MPRWSNDVHADPYSHLRHWRCVLVTAAEQRASKQPPLLFSMYTPHPRRRQRRAAPLHFTPLSYFTASARRGGSVFCTSYLYKNRLYIMIYWEKETICKIRHSAPPIARMEWSCVLPTIRLWDWSNQTPSIESSNSRIFGVTPNYYY